MPAEVDDERARRRRPPRPLPARSTRADASSPSWRGEVRTAAIAAAGGVLAGAATVAAVRAVARRLASAPSTRRLARQRARR